MSRNMLIPPGSRGPRPGPTVLAYVWPFVNKWGKEKAREPKWPFHNGIAPTLRFSLST